MVIATNRRYREPVIYRPQEVADETEAETLVYPKGEEKGTSWIALEEIDGVTLDVWIIYRLLV